MKDKILNLFTKHNTLKFNEIEKELEIRSNKLAYHIKELVKKGILIKESNSYSLSEASEYLIPYLSSKSAPLPILLIHIGDNKRAFLYKRDKRPFKDKLSLPGGRIVNGESIPDAVNRIMKEKFNISAKFTKTHSISIEQVKKKGKNSIVHSFILIFVSAKTSQPLQLTDIINNKSKMISSDFKLLSTHLKKEIIINDISTKH